MLYIYIYICIYEPASLLLVKLQCTAKKQPSYKLKKNGEELLETDIARLYMKHLLFKLLVPRHVFSRNSRMPSHFRSSKNDPTWEGHV